MCLSLRVYLELSQAGHKGVATGRPRARGECERKMGCCSETQQQQQLKVWLGAAKTRPPRQRSVL